MELYDTILLKVKSIIYYIIKYNNGKTQKGRTNVETFHPWFQAPSVNVPTWKSEAWIALQPDNAERGQVRAPIL